MGNCPTPQSPPTPCRLDPQPLLPQSQESRPHPSSPKSRICPPPLYPSFSRATLPPHSPFLPAAWICILRYHQFRDWGVGKWFNQLILWSGLLCALGTSVVGNFQVSRASGAHSPGVRSATIWDYNSQHPSGRPVLSLRGGGARSRIASWDL